MTTTTTTTMTYVARDSLFRERRRYFIICLLHWCFFNTYVVLYARAESSVVMRVNTFSIVGV